MRRILIIDDEIMITSTLSTLIEMMLGYEVITYNDPLKLIQSKTLDSEQFDLIISDFIMPGMNGLELLSEVKAKQPGIVTILLTGYSDKASAIKSINNLGLYYYLEKPWDNNELIKIIQNGIEKMQLERDLHSKVVIIEKKNSEIQRLYELLRRDFDKEMGNVLEFVISLSNVIEAKDTYTDGHTRRVSNLAIALGNKFDLDKNRIKNIEIGAIIHDIGKVSTPEAVLNKPGPLNDQEFEVIKNHPESGAKIIRPISSLSDCMEMVLSHHEKLDGTGYPNGLKADQISLETRIVAISDIFDALYTDRPYRKALPFEKIRSILDGDVQAGKIDKNVVDALYALCEEGFLEEMYSSNS